MKKELTSFHYAFQITRMVVFEVSYYRLSNNKDKYFSTSAAQFNRPNSDFNLCGQAQNDLLFGKAKTFFKKWDVLHCQDLTEDQYNDLRMDIEELKKHYNYLEFFRDMCIGFHDLKDLSKMPITKSSHKLVLS